MGTKFIKIFFFFFSFGNMIPYSGYFSRGNIFVKVVILAISWKKFRDRARGLR